MACIWYIQKLWSSHGKVYLGSKQFSAINFFLCRGAEWETDVEGRNSGTVKDLLVELYDKAGITLLQIYFIMYVLWIDGSSQDLWKMSQVLLINA